MRYVEQSRNNLSTTFSSLTNFLISYFIHPSFVNTSSPYLSSIDTPLSNIYFPYAVSISSRSSSATVFFYGDWPNVYSINLILGWSSSSPISSLISSVIISTSSQLSTSHSSLSWLSSSSADRDFGCSFILGVSSAPKSSSMSLTYSLYYSTTILAFSISIFFILS